MDLNNEILQYYIYKKLLKRKMQKTVLEECKRLDMPIEKYMKVKNYCTEVTELPAIAEFLCMPCAEMDMFEPDREWLDKFTFNFIKKHKIVPIMVTEDNEMLLGVGKPLDFNSMSMISTIFTGKIDYVLLPPTQINILIDSIAAVINTTVALDALHESQDKELIQQANAPIDEVLDRADDVINAPTVRLVDSVIKEAIPFRASDIHIEPFEKIVRVRYRIDGDLQERAEFPIDAYPAICARLKIMSGLNIAERRIPQDGRINMLINGTQYDFRVSTLPTVYGEKFVIRILDKTSFSFTRAELGFTDNENTLIDKILAHPHGIILLTGPTGCGKSTTLYSFLKEMNKIDVNVITVEDPVEYTLHGINQTQVNTKANMTFAAALRSILRQDPDIIMIGEIRDEETAQIATRAAITGHLVFSTLHTNDAPGAVTRLIDMGVKNYLVSDSLVGVISQRLVKRLCPACKKKGKTTPIEMEQLGITEPITVCRPFGCQFCNNTGYKGRVGIHEVMYVNEAIRDAINGNVTAEELRELTKQNGLISLWESCRSYVLKGVTSISELMSLYID